MVGARCCDLGPGSCVSQVLGPGPQSWAGGGEGGGGGEGEDRLSVGQPMPRKTSAHSDAD